MKITLKALKGKLFFLLVLSAVAFIVYAAVSNILTVPSHGVIKAVGISVYQDENYTAPLTVIDWGLLTPGSTVTFECWLRNEGTVNVVVNMHTENWIPDDAGQFIGFTWNVENEVVLPDMIEHVVFSLTIHVDVTIQTFSFDIVIEGSEPVVAGRR